LASGIIGRVGRYRIGARRDTVSGMAYTLINRDDPAVESFRGMFFKMRRALGTTALGVNEVRLPPETEGVEHDETETGHEEVYIVLAGSGTFTIDGDPVAVSVGDYLRVGPESNRIVLSGRDGLSFVVVAAKPQPAYDGRPSL
jgi:mannose-6-phosphate isomerase-like protein (cupin superfamily)